MTAPHRTPLSRISLFRLTITLAIVVTAVLAFTLQAGLFRLLLRGSLVVGIVLLLGSYLVQWWTKRQRNSARR